MNYLDLLPEELLQHIWKFIYNDHLNNMLIQYANIKTWDEKVLFSPYCLKITREISKKKGYYHDILKEKYNVILFSRLYYYVPCNPGNSYEEDFIRNFADEMSGGLTNSVEGYRPYPHPVLLNVLRNGDKYTKQDLYQMLFYNGYVKWVMGIEYPPNQKFMYKSWTRDRIIQELMSL